MNISAKLILVALAAGWQPAWPAPSRRFATVVAAETLLLGQGLWRRRPARRPVEDFLLSRPKTPPAGFHEVARRARRVRRVFLEGLVVERAGAAAIPSPWPSKS